MMKWHKNGGNMWLKNWLCEKNMTVVDFAKKLCISRIHCNSIVLKKRKAGARLARDIEIATGGEVTEKELRNVEIRRVK